MRIPWRKPAQGNHSLDQPARLPQRWVVILGLGGHVGLDLSTTMGPGVGLPTGLAAIGLLHSIMD
ncbi:hypothetical protein [Sphaerisporangium aureirubrum]|uniref:DUF3307 domain-containing protein n=1 Tax=Sphaerisporangium aureirubrum TaxID=1544736 RepID=A0ABW1NQQ8_9ACTN